MSKFDEHIDQKMGRKFQEELEGHGVPFQPADWAQMRERLVAAMPLYRRWWYLLPWRYAVLSVGTLALLGSIWWAWPQVLDSQTTANIGKNLPAGVRDDTNPGQRETNIGKELRQKVGGSSLASRVAPQDKAKSMAKQAQVVTGQVRSGRSTRSAERTGLTKVTEPDKSTQNTVFQPAKTGVEPKGPALPPLISPAGQGAFSLARVGVDLLPPQPVRALAVARLPMPSLRPVDVTSPPLLPSAISQPKWQVGLSVAPFVGLAQTGDLRGQTGGLEPNLWLGRRLGQRWWLSAGLGVFTFQTGLASGGSQDFRAPNSQMISNPALVTNPTYRVDLVALSLPVGVRWEFWQRGPRSLSVFAGVRSLAYLRERYVYSQPKAVFDSNRFAGVATTPVNLTPAYLVEEWSYGSLGRRDLAAQGQIALAYQRNWGQRWQWGAGPQWSFPLRKATHEGLFLHQIGLSVWLWRAGK
jgi:hypothetical protein